MLTLHAVLDHAAVHRFSLEVSRALVWGKGMGKSSGGSVPTPSQSTEVL